MSNGVQHKHTIFCQSQNSCGYLTCVRKCIRTAYSISMYCILHTKLSILQQYVFSASRLYRSRHYRPDLLLMKIVYHKCKSTLPLLLNAILISSIILRQMNLKYFSVKYFSCPHTLSTVIGWGRHATAQRLMPRIVLRNSC